MKPVRASTAIRRRKAAPDPHLARFDALCRKVQSGGEHALAPEEAAQFPNLYRYAATRLARVETEARDPAAARDLRAALARGHGILFRGIERDRRSWLAVAHAFVMRESPRAIRAEWRALATSFALVYVLALAAYVAVANDLDLAWSLLSPGTVAQEIEQLQSTPPDQPFRGNFTFSTEDSPQTAGLILGNNVRVAVLFLASGLALPLFFLVVAMNGLMLGTYLAVASHWGRTAEISSILACHGTLEIQAFVLAGAAGLVLARGLVFPGPWSRRHALRLGARRGWRLFAPVLPMLVIAALIEGFVSPHAPTPVRVAVAVASGALLLAWVCFSGREERAA